MWHNLLIANGIKAFSGRITAGDRITYCPNSQAVIWNTYENTVTQARCNKDSCPYCGKIKKWIEAKKIDWGVLALYRLGNYMTFFTLTTSWEYNGDIMKAWNRMRRYLAYYGYEQEYVIAPEYKAGKWHIHGIGSRFIPYQVLMGCWNNATNKTSWKVEVQALDMKSAPSGYLTKYITKDKDKNGKRKRKIMYSRNFPKRPKSVKMPGLNVYLTKEAYDSLKGGYIK